MTKLTLPNLTLMKKEEVQTHKSTFEKTKIALSDLSVIKKKYGKTITLHHQIKITIERPLLLFIYL